MTATRHTDSTVRADPETPTVVPVGADGGEDGESLLVELALALAQVRRGRFDVRLARRDGPANEVVEQFNELVAVQERHSRDILRITSKTTSSSCTIV